MNIDQPSIAAKLCNKFSETNASDTNNVYGYVEGKNKKKDSEEMRIAEKNDVKMYMCTYILVPVVVFILMQFTNARRISAFGHYACIICTPGICSFIYPWAWLRSMADIGRYIRTNPTYRVKLCILISTRKCPPYTEQ